MTKILHENKSYSIQQSSSKNLDLQEVGKVKHNGRQYSLFEAKQDYKWRDVAKHVVLLVFAVLVNLGTLGIWNTNIEHHLKVITKQEKKTVYIALKIIRPHSVPKVKKTAHSSPRVKKRLNFSDKQQAPVKDFHSDQQKSTDKQEASVTDPHSDQQNPTYPKTDLKEDDSKYHSKQTVSNREGGYVHSNPIITGFLERPTIPKILKDCISSYIGINSVTFTSTNTLPVASPKMPLLQKKIEHYKQKYGISMQVQSLGDLSEVLKNLQNIKSDQPVGLIILGEEESKLSHVTPLICQFNSKSGKLEVYMLDVLGGNHYDILQNKYPEPYPQIIRLLQKQGVDFKICRSPRQVDHVSCRTDALVVLRNALLHFKHLQSQNSTQSFDFVPTFKEGYFEFFNLPVEWDYGAQVTNPQLKGENPSPALVTRDFYSSEKSKRDNPRSALTFRKKHTNPITLKNSLTLYKSKISETRLAEIVNLELPPDIQIEDSDEKLIINWQEEKQVNTYMVAKGFKNARSALDAEG